MTNGTVRDVEALVPALILVLRGQIEGYGKPGLWVTAGAVRRRGLPMVVGFDLRAELDAALADGLVCVPPAHAGPVAVKLTERGRSKLAASRTVDKMPSVIKAILAALLLQP